MKYLNLIYFLILSYWGYKFLLMSQMEVAHPLDKRRRVILEGPELYLVLAMSTGLLALSAPIGLDLSAIRLFLLEVFCFIGLSKAKHRPIWSGFSVFYLLLLFWMFIGLFYTPLVSYGVRVLLKFLYALLMVLYSSAVVRDGEVFLKASLGARWMAIFTIVMTFTGLYILFPGTIWYSTALAINYIVMCMFS